MSTNLWMFLRFITLLKSRGAPLDISGVMNMRNIFEVEEQMQQITLEVTLRFVNLSFFPSSFQSPSVYFSGSSGRILVWG